MLRANSATWPYSPRCFLGFEWNDKRRQIIACISKIVSRLLAAGISYLSLYGTLSIHYYCPDEVDYHKALNIARQYTLSPSNNPLPRR